MNLSSIAQNIAKMTARASDPFIIAKASHFTEPNRTDSAWDYSADIVNFLTSVIMPMIPATKVTTDAIQVVVSEITQYLRPSNITIDYFKFPYNPKAINYSVTAHQNLTEYGNNVIVRTGWGLKTVPISMTGWVNLFPPAELFKLVGYADYRLSWGYMMLYLLEKWLKRNTNYLLFMIVGGKVWVGWYNSFSYSLNADIPFRAEFTFQFNAHPYSGEFIANAPQVIDMLKRLRMTGALTNYSYGDPIHWSIWSK